MVASLNSTFPENIPGGGDRRRRRHTGPKLRTEFLSLFGDDEFEVAEVLLDLPYVINNPVSGSRVVPSGWGTKRKRSGEKSQSTSSTPTVVSPTPPPPHFPPPLVSTASTTSPNTPLDFCTTDAEGQSKEHPTKKKKKTALKKKPDDLRKILNEELEIKQTLIKEIEKANLHLKKLQDENSELKSKQQKLMQSSSVNDCVHDGPSTPTVLQQHPPSIPDPIMNQTVQLQLQLGPVGFDLNIPAAEEDMAAVESAAPLQPLDDHQTARNIAMSGAYADEARAARHNRMQQNKLKKMKRGNW